MRFLFTLSILALLGLANCAAPPPPPGLLTQAELGAPAPDLACNTHDGRGWVRPCPLTSGAAVPAPLELVRDDLKGDGGANLKLKGGSGGPLRSPSRRLARFVEHDGRQIGRTSDNVSPVFFTHLRVGSGGVIYLRDTSGQIHYWPGLSPCQSLAPPPPPSCQRKLRASCCFSALLP